MHNVETHTFLLCHSNDTRLKYPETQLQNNPEQTPLPYSLGQAAKSYYKFNPIKMFPGLSLLWSFS